MLQCQRCHQRFDEYYRMSDGRILCKDCWRDELNLAEMKAVQGRQQRAQVLRDKDAFDQKRKADQVKLEQLEHAIKLEKGKCHSAWSSWDDGYRTDKPYNYEEVELLKRQYLDLSRQLNQNQWFKFPSTPPFSDNTAYYKTAQFISKSQSHYFETVTLPAEQEAKRKAEEDRIRAKQEAERKRIAAERERQRKIAEEHQKKEAELKPYEEYILNQKTLSLECRLKVAKETFREEVMLQCVYDLETSVVDALMYNPNITDKVRKAIYAKKEAELKPYEEYILNQKTLSLECRLKVAKETFREEVMLQCVYDLETSVVDALMYNPNITDKVRKAIYAKKEAEKKKLADEKARKEAERIKEEQKKERIKTAIWWIVGLAIASGLIFLVVLYWEAILAILVIIFLLYLFLK